ncbi:hypothetical protein BBK82_38000 [Lentzea guizhouensis]|uniref:Uncharacterized protein n=1 Tax=Lentzea guizhouensis TaxID=1586287 RepID=A0A1B2HT76_9PSEU|nr:hypothetical protein BBK82_38000 [Lentzea guizhouensis]
MDDRESVEELVGGQVWGEFGQRPFACRMRILKGLERCADQRRPVDVGRMRDQGGEHAHADMGIADRCEHVRDEPGIQVRCDLLQQVPALTLVGEPCRGGEHL